MESKKELLTEIKNIKTGKGKKITNKHLKEDIINLSKFWADYYKNYYYIPVLCESFTGKYAYFFKDVYTENLIKVTPENLDKKVEILKERAEKLNIKKALFIGFLVPYYE